MARTSIAPKSKAPSLGREHTVSEGDFKNPDHSLLGLYLRQVAAHLTLIDDLHGNSSATEMEGNCSIARDWGLTGEEIQSSLTESAIEAAARDLGKARAAMHDLFREVALKPRAVA